MEKILAMEEIQKKLLYMAKVVCSILEQNNIPYIVIDGTLLGAIRHKGFIPWDDDFDILLFDDTYDEACAVLRNELPSNMFLEDEKTEPLYFHSWAHVKDRDTSVVFKEWHQDALYSCQGLAIDLYKAKKMEKGDLNEYLLNEELLYRKRQLHAGIIQDYEYCKYEETINDKKNRMNNTGESDDSIEIYGRITKYVSPFLFVEEVFPLRKIKFESETFWGPNKPFDILARSYGNYMELPPENKRVGSYLKVLGEEA